MILVCGHPQNLRLGKIRKTSLPAPFQGPEKGVNLDENDNLLRFIDDCAKKVGEKSKEVDIKAMAQELIRLDIRAEERQRSVEDPFSSELTQDVGRLMSGFDSGDEGSAETVAETRGTN